MLSLSLVRKTHLDRFMVATNIELWLWRGFYVR